MPLLEQQAGGVIAASNNSISRKQQRRRKEQQRRAEPARLVDRIDVLRHVLEGSREGLVARPLHRLKGLAGRLRGGGGLGVG